MVSQGLSGDLDTQGVAVGLFIGELEKQRGAGVELVGGAWLSMPEAPDAILSPGEKESKVE